jgi:hypothetical protein
MSGSKADHTRCKYPLVTSHCLSFVRHKNEEAMFRLRVSHQAIAIGGVIASHTRHQPIVYAIVQRIQSLRIELAHAVIKGSRVYAELLRRSVPCKALAAVMQEAILR